MLRILFFAMLKDLVGEAEVQILLEEPTSVGAVLDRLEDSYPGLGEYRTVLLIAVNQQYSSLDAHVSAGDELALFPPVSGGRE